MTTLSNHVSISISQVSTTVARAGFGVPLILSHSASFPERVRSYNSITDVLADFAAGSVEALSATAMFAQQPHPEKVKIGRAANPVTQIYRITPTAVNDTDYKVTAAGEGVTTEQVSFTSDGTATVAEITAGLLPLLNGVTGKNFTAVDDTTHLTITGDAANDWFSLEVDDPSLLKIEQLHADPGVVADLTAISLEDDDWYCLHTNFNSNAYVLAAVAHIETLKKIYVFDVNETDAVTTTAGNSDTLDDIATANRARTAGIYHPSPIDMNAAAWMGRCLPEDPGSITWKFKTLSGPAAVDLTPTHRGNLIARSANFYEDVAGLDIMSEGTTADGDFIDVQRGLDFTEDDMQKSVFEDMASGGKVPFTDAGVALVENAMRGSLKRSVDLTIFSDDPAPGVTVPKVADVSAANKAARTLPDLKFSATLAGAIHKSIITGSVSV